jgi:hypothetical protein
MKEPMPLSFKKAVLNTLSNRDILNALAIAAFGIMQKSISLQPHFPPQRIFQMPRPLQLICRHHFAMAAIELKSET